MARLPNSGRAFTQMSATTARLGFVLVFMFALAVTKTLCAPAHAALAEEGHVEAPSSIKEEKRTVPTPSKQVRIASSDDAWTSRVCAGAGDMVSYRLQASLPSDLASYKGYQLWFDDKLGEGLAYDEGSVRSYVLHADGSSSNVQLVVSFEGQGMRVGADDVLSAVPGLLPTDKVAVEYDCVVLSSASLGLVDGNQNEVLLRYTSNHDYTSAGTSVPQATSVHALGIELHKVDANDDAALAGAHFTLQNDKGQYRTEAGLWTDQMSEAQVAVTDDEGAATFAGVAAGTYTIAETKAPDGYETIKAPVTVKLEVADLGTAQPTLTATATGEATVTAVDGASGIATLTVENPKSSGDTKTPDKESEDKSSGGRDSGGKRNGGSTPKSTTTSGSSEGGSSGSTSSTRSSLATTADTSPIMGTGVLVLAVTMVVAGAASGCSGIESSDTRAQAEKRQ